MQQSTSWNQGRGIFWCSVLCSLENFPPILAYKGGLGEIRVVGTESLLSVLDPKSPSQSSRDIVLVLGGGGYFVEWVWCVVCGVCRVEGFI
jgi:hypothetical protein